MKILNSSVLSSTFSSGTGRLFHIDMSSLKKLHSTFFDNYFCEMFLEYHSLKSSLQIKYLKALLGLRSRLPKTTSYALTISTEGLCRWILRAGFFVSNFTLTKRPFEKTFKNLWDVPNFFGLHILPCQKQKTIWSTGFQLNRWNNEKAAVNSKCYHEHQRTCDNFIKLTYLMASKLLDLLMG